MFVLGGTPCCIIHARIPHTTYRPQRRKRTCSGDSIQGRTQSSRNHTHIASGCTCIYDTPWRSRRHTWLSVPAMSPLARPSAPQPGAALFPAPAGLPAFAHAAAQARGGGMQTVTSPPSRRRSSQQRRLRGTRRIGAEKGDGGLGASMDGSKLMRVTSHVPRRLYKLQEHSPHKRRQAQQAQRLGVTAMTRLGRHGNFMAVAKAGHAGCIVPTGCGRDSDAIHTASADDLQIVGCAARLAAVLPGG